MDDSISRKAAIDAIKTWGLIDGLSEGQAIEILADEEKVPPIQPEHGHWIGKPIAGYSTVRCSKCGNVLLENDGKFPYCPYCGTKMDEVNE